MCLHVGVWGPTCVRARVCARMCVKGLTICVRLYVRTKVCGCSVCARICVQGVFTVCVCGAAVCAHGYVRAKRIGDAMMGRSLNKKVGVMA